MSALSILAEECELLNDSKYRSYITQVDKALKSFEYTSEWADLISALGKLNKVLLGHVKYPVIPKRVTIGKRLAQCLHPALPSGVHLKALETYDIIFKCIGTQRLAQDLFIYSAGLFPLLSHASMSVKPMLLTVYERHFVALGKHIKPGLNGMLLGLLPGLEEGSEFYDRTNALLQDFCESAEPEYFYTCMWECVMSCPSVRLPAISFLLTHFNKKKTMEDQLYMMGLNIDLMVEAICNAIQDQMVLVQRSLLDFLLLAFPMHNGQLTKADMGKIVRAVINVVLRRDMSLNRRLYAWLLGSNSRSSTSLNISKGRGNKRDNFSSSTSSESEEATYFQLHSKDPLIQALKNKLSYSREEEETAGGIKTEARTAVLKPFRILMSLLDKPEIGPVILESVLLSVFRCLHRECCVRGKENEDTGTDHNGDKTKTANKAMQLDVKTIGELIKTANLLFGAFEPFFIWDYIARMFEESCRASISGPSLSRSTSVQETDIPSLPELCRLIDYLLEVVSLDTFLETQTEHLPDLLYRITTSLTNHCQHIIDADIRCTLKLCSKLLAKVQPSNTILGMDTSSSEMVFDDMRETLPNSKSEVQSSGPQNKDKQGENIEQSMDSISVNKHEKSLSDKNTEGGNTMSTDSDKKTHTKSTDTEQYKQTTNGDIDLETTSRSLKRSLSRGWSRQDSKSPTMMQSCVDCFKHFFHTYITQKILKDPNISSKFVQSISVQSAYHYGYSDDDDSALESSSVFSLDFHYQGDEPCETLPPFNIEHLNDESVATFSCACKLLLDFSSFPIYCTDCHQILKRTYSTDENLSLPPWLQDLVTCSCYIRHFEVQSAAIATLLDLIIVAQTVQSDSEHKNDLDLGYHKSVNEGTVSVVIMPALLPLHLKYLGDKTLFYKRVAQILWEYLGEASPSCHQQSVELFHQLHQITPSSWVCEDVIGHALVSDSQDQRIAAFKKFTILWHLTRDNKDSNPGHPPRSFDRSMFVLLDSLKEDSSPIKTIASTWLTHIIQRADICRVLNPLLSMLLHPDTARVSVQHVNVHQPKKVRISESEAEEEVDQEARIYAISSEGGNVIYHVSSDNKKISGKSSEDLKSLALTVMNKKGAASTAPTSSHSEQELHFERVQPDDLNLRVNPFGSQSSLDKVIFEGLDPPAQQFDPTGFKRLDKDTCAKEGIFFDGNDAASQSSNDTLSQGEVNPESIVEEILMEIVTRVVPPELQSCALEDDENGDEEEEDEIVTAANFDGELTKPEKKAMPGQRKLSVTSKTSSVMEDQDILNSVDSKGLQIDSPTASELDLTQTEEQPQHKRFRDIHALHMHMLLYTQKYDYKRTLYALTTIKSMLVTCPRLVVTAMVTTSISANRLIQLAKLQMLLARHRKSVFGKNFYGELPPEVMSGYRSNMFIEVVMSICLYFIRSYYPNLMMSKLSQEELLGNQEVHIQAAQILTLLMSELIIIMKESGKSFMSYIKDLLTRCKLQKTLLHCCLASVYNMRKKDKKVNYKITEAIITFNEENLDPAANETFQVHLLNLMLVVVMLEGRIDKIYGDKSDSMTSSSADWERPRINFQQSLLHVRYNPSQPIVQQGMFLSCVISALKQKHMRHMHRHWVAMVTSALPFMGKAIPNTVINVVAQLCRNIEGVAAMYEGNKQKVTAAEKLPPDHILTMIEGLTTICHYCLLDNASPVSVGLPAPTTTNITTETGSAGHILTNLIHVFNPIGNSRETSPKRELSPLQPVLDARRSLLSIMPRIIACMASLWKAVKVVEDKELDKGDNHSSWIMGAPRVVRQKVLEFLSPISLPHGTNLLGAVGVAWNDRRKKTGGAIKKMLLAPSKDQLLLVDLVSAVKVLPTDTLVQTVKQVLKQPPPTDLGRAKKSFPLEVNMLQFFYAYVQQTSASQLVDSWTSLLSLLRESLQLNLSPLGKFLLLQILNEFVQKMPSMEDKKNQKELQEISQRLLEAVALIAGSSLEQTTWLRRNLAVKPGPQTDRLEIDEEDDTVDELETGSLAEAAVKQRNVVDPKLSSADDSKFSVQALSILAEMTAPLLDVVYSSEEKDKVAPFLSTIMYNVFPYLRNHSSHNLPSYRACSKFLASVSGYQYTRKAWRKEALELLLDQGFFQMDVHCIGYWRAVIDNLMTHDKTTFKDLMSRVTMAQSGSLSLFSSKEQELEQRAHMLKRLAFTIFCSEPDQYQKAMPDIQERLAESLRLPHQVPSIMAQVFLCFRVLILRMSCHHLTSLWPTVITEMIHVFMQIEQELSNDTDEYKTQIQRIAALDSSWAHLGNGLNAHNNPAWLQLYLSVSKLLDLALALPADVVPQFQLYRWAFIGGAAAGNQDNLVGEAEEQNDKKDERKKMHFPPVFVPHVIRLTKLINERVKGDTPILKQNPGRPLLTMTHMRSLAELQPFFNTLCCSSQSDSSYFPTHQPGTSIRAMETAEKVRGHERKGSFPKSKSTPELGSKTTKSVSDVPITMQAKSNRQYIEDIIERDFLEPLSGF